MVTKLHIDFNKPLKQKDRLLSIFSSRKAVAGLIILIVAIWMIPGLFVENNEKSEAIKRDDTEKVFVVSAQKVQNRDTYKVVRASGVLKPVFEVDVLSKKDGEVKEIVKQRGQLVEKNDVILEIDKGTILEQLEAGEAALRLEEKNFSITESLSKKDMTSELNLVRAEASLTRAKADIANLRNNLKNSTVVAGIGGVLELLNVEAGQFVKKNQNIGKIIDLSKMLLFAPVAQTDVAKISLSDEVVINVTGVGNRRGVVKRIASSASEATRTFIQDSLGVGIVGSAAPQVDEMRRAAALWGESEDARVWVSGESLPAPSAAFLNAFLTHNSEFDCVHEPAVVHCVTVVLAACMAVAERHGGVEEVHNVRVDEPRDAQEEEVAARDGVDVHEVGARPQPPAHRARRVEHVQEAAEQLRQPAVLVLVVLEPVHHNL